MLLDLGPGHAALIAGAVGSPPGNCGAGDGEGSCDDRRDER